MKCKVKYEMNLTITDETDYQQDYPIVPPLEVPLKRSETNLISFPTVSPPLRPKAQRRNDLRFATDPPKTQKQPSLTLNNIFGIQQWLWHKFVPSTTTKTATGKNGKMFNNSK